MRLMFDIPHNIESDGTLAPTVKEICGIDIDFDCNEIQAYDAASGGEIIYCFEAPDKNIDVTAAVAEQLVKEGLLNEDERKSTGVFECICKRLLEKGFCDVSHTGGALELKFKGFFDELHPELY